MVKITNIAKAPGGGPRLAAILTFSFSAMFTVLFFAPFDMYLHNPAEFLVSWKLLLPPLLIFALIAAWLNHAEKAFGKE
jgi:hypothetical protein